MVVLSRHSTKSNPRLSREAQGNLQTVILLEGLLKRSVTRIHRRAQTQSFWSIALAYQRSLRKARDDSVCLIVEGRHRSPELEAVTLAREFAFCDSGSERKAVDQPD